MTSSPTNPYGPDVDAAPTAPKRPGAMPFHVFCLKVLGLKLSPAQEAVVRVAFDNEDPVDLPEPIRDLAIDLFGGVDRFPAKARDYVTLTLGRGSGKTTLSAAWALHTALFADVSRVKYGHVGVVPLMSFDRDMAAVGLAAVRGFIEAAKLEGLLVRDRGDEIRIRRPDGSVVGIKVFTPNKGGKSIRGRHILSYLIDEAQFLNPSEDGRYLINDADIIQALNARLEPGGKGIFISTPWPTPTPTVMRELHDNNYGSPSIAVSALGTTLQMRGDDPHVVAIVEREFERDPEAAKRELDCDDSSFSTGSFFDPVHILSCVDAEFPLPRMPLWPAAVGVDLAFTSDSTAIVVVQFDGDRYRTSYIEELVPTRTNPLKPSAVFKRISEVCDLYKVKFVIADGHYREALHEHLDAFKVSIVNAPEGVLGKEDAYKRAKAVLHEHRCSIPRMERFALQLKSIVARPTAGGHLSIKAPRRKGAGHGDIVSAWVNALHYLTYTHVSEGEGLKLKQGDVGYEAWIQKRQEEAERVAEAEHLKRMEARVAKENKRRWRREKRALRRGS